MPAEPNSAKDLFLAAAELAPAERTAYLDRACLGDAELRRRVEALLRAHDEPGSFPAKPPVQIVATLDSDHGDFKDPGETSGPGGSDVLIGNRIGPYKILQQLGEGGMGTVYMAEQADPVRRMVALKIIRTGLDTRQVVARFEAERQALALMDHPNIARVLDAGTTADGRPFFAMELVKGIPITRFCDEHHLTPRERLELFVPVCQAVQHAHQKGIIHRDLKPTNVLVALYDDRPVPKVIDFGVAKATSQKLTDRTMFTEFGSVVGTLEYMSPEQAKLNALDVDTRSDIYALGVLLYELLTGTTPIERKRLKESALDELLRVIREEEPPLPSTRLGQSKESLPAVAAQRHTEPAKLAKLVRGELDWIVMKALEKDRTRRYETASSLAHDIERYLGEQPVEACPPSAGYRLRKFFRRNRGPVLAAALLLLALVGGIVGTTWGLVSASRALTAEEQQRGVAEHERDEKEQARTAAEHEKDEKEKARAAAESTLYFNRVNLAHQYLQSNNLAQSRRILDLCPSGSRGWEWRYLDRLSRGELLTLPGNGEFTTALHLSKDGKRLAAFARSGDAGVRIWDLAADKPLAEISLSRNHRHFSAAAINPDGRTIALGEKSGAVSLWDADTGQLAREFAKLPRFVGSLSFSPDGRRLAATTAANEHVEESQWPAHLPGVEPTYLAMNMIQFAAMNENELVVWDIASGKEIFHPKGCGLAAQFSPDGLRLLTLKKIPDYFVALWVAPEFRPLPAATVALFDTASWTEMDGGDLGPANRFAFSADGKRLALGGYYQGMYFVRVIDPATGNVLRTLAPTVERGSFDIALSPDGATLALTKGLGFREIEVCDWETRSRDRTLRGHSDSINNLAFTAAGQLVSCSRDRTIKFWDPAEREVRRLARPRAREATLSALSRDGTLIAFYEDGFVIDDKGTHKDINFIDLGTSRAIRPPTGGVPSALGHLLSIAVLNSISPLPLEIGTGSSLADSRGTSALSCSAHGTRLVSGERSGEVKTWDLATQKELCTYRGHDGKITAVALSPDERWAASAQEPKEMTKSPLAKGQPPPKPLPVAIKVWDAETAKERISLTGHPGAVHQLALNSDGRLLASAGDGVVKIWDLSTGAALRELNKGELHSGTDDALVFGPAGDLLATAGEGTVQLWDVATGRSLAVLQGHQGSGLSVAISPDQSRLATAAGRQVKLWDARTGQEALTLPLPQIQPNERAADVAALAWTADGHRLRAAFRDGSVVEWDAMPKRAPEPTAIELK